MHVGSLLRGTLIFGFWALVYSPCILNYDSLASFNSRLETCIHSSICNQDLEGVTSEKLNFIFSSSGPHK